MVKKNALGHDIRSDGGCCLCKRRDADLKTACPGYATAGELMKWKPRPVAHATKKKGAKR